MKLGRKNLLYSLLLAGIMLLFLVGYFICMLPSLYVDHVREQNLISIKEQHRAYMETGSYEGVRVNNLTACFSIKVPNEGDSIFITGKAFSAEMILKDEKIKEKLAEIRKNLQNFDTEDVDAEFARWDELGVEPEKWGENIKNVLEKNNSLPFDIHFLYMADINSEYKNESVKVHNLSKHGLIFEASIEDSDNKYTNYIAVETTGDAVVFSLLPIMTPEMGEISPIVLQSLPMLGAVILLVVLIFSQIYSRGIVTPIVRLAAHTEQMKVVLSHTEEDDSISAVSADDTQHSCNRAIQKCFDERKNQQDEIRELAAVMDDLYARILESYRSLEEKNEELLEENKRQEIFLRASSHQLKTPISAALLLVDGMINQIGKYKDKDLYLPQVKKQLLAMRTIVEDILYLNRCGDNLNFQNIEIRAIIEERLLAYQVALADREISVMWEGEETMQIVADETLVSQVLDNLVSNAIKYTPAGAIVRVVLRDNAERKFVCIENEGVTIPEELLPHIFDAFVSGNHGTGSHGLGLYIASYYAKKLGAELSVCNGENSVAAELIFHM